MNKDVLTFLAIVLLGAITFLYRFSFISERGRVVAEKIPEKFLDLLAPSVFTAIVVGNLVSVHGKPEFQPKLIALAASAVVAYFSRSITATLMFGLVVVNYLLN